jgi:hypothetical protein
MRIYKKLVIDMESGSILEADSFEYDGPVALAKGDSTAQAGEQIQNENAQQQLDFSKQLQSAFTSQYGAQSAITSFLTNKMESTMSNPQGFGADALAAMRTSATDTNANQYQQAEAASQRTSFAQGGRDLPSGVDSQISGAIAASGAANNAASQNQITLQNEQQKQSNYWNAANSLSGTAATINPLGYAGASSSAGSSAASAGNSTASLSNANTNAASNSFLGKLGGSLASSLGSGIGSGLAGGLGTQMSTIGSGNFGW